MTLRPIYTAVLLCLSLAAVSCTNDDGPVNTTTFGKISGRVTNSAGEAVAGAAVSTTPATQSKTTQADGTFEFPDVAPGTYVVAVEKAGYNPATTTVGVVAGKTATADVVMSSGPANGVPDEPMNPSPSDGAVAQPIELTLRWNATDPDNDTLRFDVLFGTTNPPTAVVTSNQPQRVHYIAGLDSGTTYYWQVIAKDNRGGTSSSPVWRFRTEQPNENKAPLPPSNPSPGNGNVHASSQVTLSWTGQDPDQDHLRYDVYFGTTEAPAKIATGLTATSITRSGLIADAQYYWRVVAFDNHGGEATGPVWTFTTSQFGGGTLVAHYRLDNNGSDASGNGLHGIVDRATPTTNRHGQEGLALSFNGSAHVSVPHHFSLVFANQDFTVSAWVRPAGPLDDYAGIVSKCTPTAPEIGYQLVVRNTNRFGVQAGSKIPNAQSYFDLIGGTLSSSWHHVAMVVKRDSRTIKLYIDGVQTVSSIQDRLAYSMDQNAPLYIGRERQGVRWFRGGIDDVKIFSEALSDTQVRNLALE